jgi:hypothetical protein
MLSISLDFVASDDLRVEQHCSPLFIYRPILTRIFRQAVRILWTVPSHLFAEHPESAKRPGWDLSSWFLQRASACKPLANTYLAPSLISTRMYNRSWPSRCFSCHGPDPEMR